MSITRSTIAAVSITAGIAGALVLSAMPAQAHPGDNGTRGGGFVVDCSFSHSATVDPIVMPGHTGMGHLHEFFGNTTTNENSTGATLLAGSTTCRDSNDLSAYWVPALFQDGVRVAPTSARVMYGGRGANVTAFPAGFMAVAGRTDQTAAWGCATPGERPTFGTNVASVPTCAAGSSLVAQITFPQCWDGTSLDSADHISNLVFATTAGGQAPVCPADHPVQVPQVRIAVSYPAAATGGSGVTLSSGAASTLHADIFEAWTGTSLQNRISGRGGQRPAAAGGQNRQQGGQFGQRGGQAAAPTTDVTGAQAGAEFGAQDPAQAAATGQGNRGDGGRRGPGQRGGGAAPAAPAAPIAPAA